MTRHMIHIIAWSSSQTESFIQLTNYVAFRMIKSYSWWRFLGSRGFLIIRAWKLNFRNGECTYRPLSWSSLHSWCNRSRLHFLWLSLTIITLRHVTITLILLKAWSFAILTTTFFRNSIIYDHIYWFHHRLCALVVHSICLAIYEVSSEDPFVTLGIKLPTILPIIENEAFSSKYSEVFHLRLFFPFKSHMTFSLFPLWRKSYSQCGMMCSPL